MFLGRHVLAILLIPLVAAAQEQPAVPAVPLAKDATPLPGTAALTMEGDIASLMIEGIDRFLLRALEESQARRRTAWAGEGTAVLTQARERLRHILGLRDARVPFDAPEYVATVNRTSLVGRGKTYEIHAIRWPAFAQVHGEGLLIVPTGKEPVANIIAIPDASQTPEQLVGLSEGTPAELQYGRHLAEAGCRVVIPMVINRETDRKAGLTNREFVYRSAFELGRHLIGYEVQKVLAAVDWLSRGPVDVRLAVMGWGDGGMLALYAAALDRRIEVASVCGYVDDRRAIWRQPIDRNVFGLLERFGDAELLAMSLLEPRRRLFIEPVPGPVLSLPAGKSGAPAVLERVQYQALQEEYVRAGRITANRGVEAVPNIHPAAQSKENEVRYLVSELTDKRPMDVVVPTDSPQAVGALVDTKARHARQLDELDRHNQHILAESAKVREQFMSKLDTSSVEKHAATVEAYRTIFREQVIGHFENPLLPLNARSRKTYDSEKWTGYEVVLDVFPDVIAYGLLLLPKDLKEGDKRPVVVCQHGLEGRPQHLIGAEGYRSYKAYASQLADRGFIVFAPQNPYIFRDRFRTLQRKAYPLGKTLFSIITPQHQQIINFLKTLPNVDGERIAFYGLSYGGKTAMRVPALLKDYCLSICSADFNEWVWKNASTRDPKYSYVFTGEYEIFEWNLGSTFNYAEMAALIAPRPFMVERGHDDTVAPDEMVAYEYAKVRRMYTKMGIRDRTEIEVFNGPHTINGKGTFDFLHKHLNWPKPGEAKSN